MFPPDPTVPLAFPLERASNPIVVLYLLSFVLGVGLAVLVSLRGSNSTIRLFAGWSVVNAFWGLCYGLLLISTSLTTMRFLQHVVVLLAFLDAGVFFLFALSFTNYGSGASGVAWFRRAAGGYMVVSGLVVVTSPPHDLLLREFRVIAVVGASAVRSTNGPLFIVLSVVGWGLAFTGVVLLWWYAIDSDRLYRNQAITLAIAVLLPLVASIPDGLGLIPISTTPLVYVLSTAIIGASVFRYQFSEAIPLSRKDILDELEVGIVVVDSEREILELNPRAERILRTWGTGNPCRGASLTSFLPSDSEPLDLSQLESGTDLTADHDEKPRWYRLRSTPYRTPVEDGYIVTLTDVTNERLRQDQLERQNEHLDQFAGVVSHDLRNPLNVLMGNLKLLEADIEDGGGPEQTTTVDPSRVHSMAAAAERMDDIIDDALAFGRQGKAVTETEPVSLAAVATEAWSAVETGDATLTVEADTTIRADRARLLRILENLFRNSVEHRSAGDQGTSGDPGGGGSGELQPGPDGPSPVVTVGPLDGEGGFYVEDDGPGIPPEQCERVFERGYTTAAEGTGFGLAIVENVARAHGWTVSVTDAETGGARFEFTGVERASERPIPSG